MLFAFIFDYLCVGFILCQLCKQLEQEIEGDQRKKEEEEKRSIGEKKMKSNKGLKGVVKSCMGSSRLKPEV